MTYDGGVSAIRLAAATAAAWAAAAPPSVPPAFVYRVGPGGHAELTVRCAQRTVTAVTTVRRDRLAAVRTVLTAEQALVRGGRYGFRTELDRCSDRQARRPLAHALGALRARRLVP